MEDGWTRHLVIMVISALVVLVLTSWDKSRTPDKRGWRNLKPGAMYHFAVVGGTLLTMFLAYIWLFVGSNRPDGESQMRILFWLIMALGGGTFITLLQFRAARRLAMQWRGDVLVWRGKRGMEHRRMLSEAVALRQGFMGPAHIVFEDGAEVRIDPYVNNAPDLVDVVARRLGLDGTGPG